ncbi:MAG: tRNA(Ile)-lysidine synthetase [uncultured Corynebacteriales bacterium]|uniref:tRNA(Ile)-lysidine synthetase n=1 Tax=uncultured Mycobacteriales bacterium TaxID=581187 RepID=A0A6J4HEP9_9ACTN|nr:MAG: tRNA(Ile)-lysidine synthetase [uncultured Corynebacteriales bacterium]
MAAAATPDAAALPVADLAGRPAAVRTRIVRGWLAARGVPGLGAAQLRAVDALVTDWHGQGPVSLPSGAVVTRSSGMLLCARTDR